MKIEYHIPTEQYGFVSITLEGDTIPYSYSELKNELAGLAKEGQGSKDFNKVLDKYLETQTLTSEEYEELNDEEKKIIQTLKRAFKRKNNDK